jgi:hypothetical protein
VIKKSLNVRSHDDAAFFEVFILFVALVDDEDFFYWSKGDVFDALRALWLSNVLCRDPFLTEHSL